MPLVHSHTSNATIELRHFKRAQLYHEPAVISTERILKHL